MNYDRAHVRAFYAGLTPDSRPCGHRMCPLMVVYPAMRKADATRADPELVNAIDRYYAERYRSMSPPWSWERMTAGDVLQVLDSLP